MIIKEMSERADLTVVSAMAAIELLGKLEAGALGGPQFIELQFSPKSGELTAARVVAQTLLEAGIGVKLSIHWPFRGTNAWAIQTETHRVVNRGM